MVFDYQFIIVIPICYHWLTCFKIFGFSETNGGGSIPSGNVLPSSGPIGLTPNRTFWPEPPPPYSPCSIAPPHWASVGRQAPGLMAPPPVAVPYGQTPTATAVTRTDFYQPSFGGVRFLFIHFEIASFWNSWFLYMKLIRLQNRAKLR